MGWWHVDADTLAQSRFVPSPLAETTAALKTLDRGTAAHPGEHAWLDAHLPAYRERQAADPATALLVQIGLGLSWNAEFLTPTPAGDREHTFQDELAAIRGTPAHQARTDLTVSLNGPLPTLLDRGDLPERAADLLQWVWARTVQPTWPRRRSILEADVVARTRRLAEHGWAAALTGMRPGMRWLGEGRLQINTHDHPPMQTTGAQLLLVPITLSRGWVSWQAPHRYAVVYACSGVLADPARAPAPQALRDLLGPARAAVLVLLDTPMSTTQLVALTGQALGSVGRHLKILHDAHLIQRRRAGRSVLYYRTSTGQTLIEAQTPT